MKKRFLFTLPIILALTSFTLFKKKIATVYLIGDSTVADYSLEDNYASKRFPLVGWGQMFQQFLVKDSLCRIRNITTADSLKVDDRAKGGRSTRTFFQEGRWSAV
ncbi:MAG TPA: GDSL family lipase, partial [Pelobium sp.]|nr:GDSL family lipase [Pelobium sp.]